MASSAPVADRSDGASRPGIHVGGTGQPTVPRSREPVEPAQQGRAWGLRRACERLPSWMLVTPVDVSMTVLPALWAPQHVKALLSMALTTQLMITNGRRYRTRLHVSVLDELPWLVGRLLTATALVATVTALRHEQDAVTSFLITALAAMGLFVAGRVITMQVVLFGRRRRLVAHPTLLVGAGPLAAEVAEVLERHPRYGLRVEGFVDDNQDTDCGPTTGRLGRLCDVDTIVPNRRIRVVVVVCAAFTEDQLLRTVWRLTSSGCEVLVIPRLHQLNVHGGLPDHVGSITVMRVNKPALRGPARAVKRAFDVVVSVFALIVLLPVLVACAVAVRIEGGPGILFRQQRVGRDGQRFNCLKFRTVAPTDPSESATRWSVANDSRVGSVGRLMRRLSLDELPQLWNIVRGEMTLVGPRPERPHFVSKFSAEIPHYADRHRVRAGLTGLAQVSGLRGDTSITDRARFDNYYIEYWSLWMDAKILLRTLGAVITGRGS